MPLHALSELEQISSSQFKKLGWRGALRRLKRSTHGALAITINGKTRGVLLTPEEYERLIRLAFPNAAQDDEVLEALRRQFDQHLASLNEPGASDRMRKAATEPLDIEGKYRVDD